MAVPFDLAVLFGSNRSFAVASVFVKARGITRYPIFDVRQVLPNFLELYVGVGEAVSSA